MGRDKGVALQKPCSCSVAALALSHPYVPVNGAHRLPISELLKDHKT